MRIYICGMIKLNTPKSRLFVLICTRYDIKYSQKTIKCLHNYNIFDSNPQPSLTDLIETEQQHEHNI